MLVPPISRPTDRADCAHFRWISHQRKQAPRALATWQHPAELLGCPTVPDGDDTDKERGTTMKTSLLSACAMFALATTPAMAQSKTVKIGFVSTFSGPT